MLPLLLGLAQAPDPRMAARATLERPRLTYAEFGAWAQNRTGLPVTVAAAIRERKATVLVADRPVAETMARFAEAFFLEWERTAGGLTLRLMPKVAAEERAAQDAERGAREAGLRQAIDAVTAMSRMSPESIRAERERLTGDSSPAAQARRSLVERFGGDAESMLAGELLAGLSPERREAMLAGARVFGSERGGAGVVAVSLRQAAALSRFAADHAALEGEKPKAANGLLVSLRGDPARGRVEVLAVPTVDGKTLSIGFSALDGEPYDLPESPPIEKRIADWAKGDDAPLATPLSRDETPLPDHSSSRHTLADLLVSLHRRSGLPIVADGFREAVPDDPDAAGPDVRAWVTALTTGVQGIVGENRYATRAAGGWLEVRRRGYWRRLATEPPECAVRLLERPAPTLEDAAAFAAALTPAQEGGLEPDQLVMDAPNDAVFGKVSFLRLWAVLPPSQRARARREGGLSFSLLSPTATRAAYALLDDLENANGPDDAALRLLMPGASPPSDLTLRVEAKGDIEGYDSPTFVSIPGATPPIPVEHHREGWTATVEAGGGERLYIMVDIPLTEKRPTPVGHEGHGFRASRALLHPRPLLISVRSREQRPKCTRRRETRRGDAAQ